MEYMTQPSTDVQRDTASLAWFSQAVSGLVLVGLLVLHMIANHFVVEGGLQTYQDVVDYLSNPVIAVLEVGFLVFVTAHALLGVRAIIFDTGLTQRGERRVTWILALLSLAMIVYGIWLTFTIIS